MKVLENSNLSSSGTELDEFIDDTCTPTYGMRNGVSSTISKRRDLLRQTFKYVHYSGPGGYSGDVTKRRDAFVRHGSANHMKTPIFSDILAEDDDSSRINAGTNTRDSYLQTVNNGTDTQTESLLPQETEYESSITNFDSDRPVMEIKINRQFNYRREANTSPPAGCQLSRQITDDVTGCPLLRQFSDDVVQADIHTGGEQHTQCTDFALNESTSKKRRSVTFADEQRNRVRNKSDSRNESISEGSPIVSQKTEQISDETLTGDGIPHSSRDIDGQSSRDVIPRIDGQPRNSHDASPASPDGKSHNITTRDSKIRVNPLKEQISDCKKKIYLFDNRLSAYTSRLRADVVKNGRRRQVSQYLSRQLSRTHSVGKVENSYMTPGPAYSNTASCGASSQGGEPPPPRVFPFFRSRSNLRRDDQWKTCPGGDPAVDEVDLEVVGRPLDSSTGCKGQVTKLMYLVSNWTAPS